MSTHRPRKVTGDTDGWGTPPVSDRKPAQVSASAVNGGMPRRQGCGEYCEACGDCLACYGDDPCGRWGSDGHVWPLPDLEEDE